MGGTLFFGIAAVAMVAGLMVRRYTGGTRVFLVGMATAVPVGILLSWLIL